MTTLRLVIGIFASIYLTACGLPPPTNPFKTQEPGESSPSDDCLKTEVTWNWQYSYCVDAPSLSGKTYEGTIAWKGRALDGGSGTNQKFEFQTDNVIVTYEGTAPQSLTYQQHGTCLRVVNLSACRSTTDRFYTLKTDGSQFTDQYNNSFIKK